LPEFKEYHYSWEQLENTVHQLIPYKLQQMQQWLTWEPPLPNSPPTTTHLICAKFVRNNKSVKITL
jgi:S-DNA-T family DNA segregation ATPase FtsK/SpoIIIE